MHRPIVLAVAALALTAASARAGDEASGSLEAAFASMGIASPQNARASVAVPVGVDKSTPEPRSDVEYEPPDITKDLEGLNRTTWIKRKGRKKPVQAFIVTGVTPANRLVYDTKAGTLLRSDISAIVIHSSLGQASDPAELARRDAINASLPTPRFKSCEGSLKYLKQQRSAAHFIVCRDGRVLQMAEMKDVANHVKNDAFNQISVGIETDTGYAGKTPFFPGDWDPNKRWRLSVGLAKTIRMIHIAAGVQLDEAHIKTHDEVDAPYCDQAGCDAHADPGPYFKALVRRNRPLPYAGVATERVPVFGDPGSTTTPYENLLRLVTDNAPPRMTFVSGNNGSTDQIRSEDDTGVGRVIIWKMLIPRVTLLSKDKNDPVRNSVSKVYDWDAAKETPDAMPPAAKMTELPTVPGEYEIETRDLVGNRTYFDFDVTAPGAPPIARATPEPPVGTVAADGASE